MVLIEWDESFSVGINEIDNQHKRWIGIINKLNDAMVQGRTEEVLGEIISGLIDYTQYHFGVEEKYFEEFDYGAAEDHKQQHLIFVGNIEGFQQDFTDKKRMVSIELLDFLKDWLINHIQVTDKKYHKCFIEHGLK